MYCNFTKCHAFPIAIRASSQQPKCLLQFYINPKTPKYTPTSDLGKPRRHRISSIRFVEKTHEYCQLLRPADRDTANRECFSNSISNSRKFSTSYSRNAVESSDSVKSLPWLAKNKDKEVKDYEKSPERFTKNGREKIRRKDFKQKSGSSVDESDTRKPVRSSWEESAKKYAKNVVGNSENGRRLDERNDYRERRKISEDESAKKIVKNSVERNGFRERKRVSEYESESDSENEEVDNPKWYKIQERFDRFDEIDDVARNGNEFRKFNRQDNFGKKVWKEATESSVPKMVGESVYGIGPVLAALSANRREFYYLYVREGIDLTGNNRKKKDKKGFEKVLKVAEKLGLPIKEISKHDLNMIVDSRPHQGLVLDASPLEMVNIRELDRVISDENENENEDSPLWLALDEVMDPQNLGAIIRSAYFFGASGVVLCAKNSAPLSGVVSKASAGALELTELRSCKNMMQFLVSSAENGWRVVGGSVSSRAVGLGEVKPGRPTVLVLGSEGTGLRPLVERSCTQLVKIPGNIPVHVSAGLDGVETQEFESFLAVESLNVSVAAGVMLHHFVGNKSAVGGGQGVNE